MIDKILLNKIILSKVMLFTHIWQRWCSLLPSSKWIRYWPLWRKSFSSSKYTYSSVVGDPNPLLGKRSSVKSKRRKESIASEAAIWKAGGELRRTMMILSNSGCNPLVPSSWVIRLELWHICEPSWRTNLLFSTISPRHLDILTVLDSTGCPNKFYIFSKKYLISQLAKKNRFS